MTARCLGPVAEKQDQIITTPLLCWQLVWGISAGMVCLVFSKCGAGHQDLFFLKGGLLSEVFWLSLKHLCKPKQCCHVREQKPFPGNTSKNAIHPVFFQLHFHELYTNFWGFFLLLSLYQVIGVKPSYCTKPFVLCKFALGMHFAQWQ